MELIREVELNTMGILSVIEVNKKIVCLTRNRLYILDKDKINVIDMSNICNYPCLVEIDENTVCTGGYQGAISFYDVNTRKSIYSSLGFLSEYTNSVTALCKKDDSLYIGFRDGIIRKMDIKAKKFRKCKDSHSDVVVSILKYKDMVISFSIDGLCKIWKDRQLVAQFDGCKDVINVAKLRDDSFIVVCKSKVIRVDLENMIEEVLKHDQYTTAIQLRDGRILQNFKSGNLHVYSLLNKKEFIVKSLDYYPKAILQLHNGNIVTVGTSGILRIWTLYTKVLRIKDYKDLHFLYQ